MIKVDSLRKEEPFYGSSKRSSFPRFIYLCVIKETKDKGLTFKELTKGI